MGMKGMSRARLVAVITIGALVFGVGVALAMGVDTVIESGPADGTVITISGATFSFDSPGSAGTKYECAIDGAATYTACTSPTTPQLPDGQHSFTVRSTDTGSGPGTPTTRSWTVDTTPPETTITSGPGNGVTSGASPSFSFSSEQRATFECKLDTEPFSACSSPKSYSSVADGAHTFQVRATDAAGNPDPSPASRTFTVDTTAPTVTLASNKGGVICATTHLALARAAAKDRAYCAGKFAIELDLTCPSSSQSPCTGDIGLQLARQGSRTHHPLSIKYHEVGMKLSPGETGPVSVPVDTGGSFGGARAARKAFKHLTATVTETSSGASAVVGKLDVLQIRPNK